MASTYCVRLFVRIVLTRVFEDVVDFHLDYGLRESSLYADPQATADVDVETNAVLERSAKRMLFPCFYRHYRKNIGRL